MSFRQVPPGWMEFTAQFVDEVSYKLHPTWRYCKGDMGTEVLVCWPEGAESPVGAWAVLRKRLLGEPIPIHMTDEEVARWNDER